MKNPSCLIALFIPILLLCSSISADPDMLQDICVADLASTIKVNGFVCKQMANVTAADFSFLGIAKPGATNNTFGSMVTPANVMQIPGLNTLGVSMARIDYAPGGLNPPHTHPRATEIVFVLEGQLDVGFITTTNKLFMKTIVKGEVFAFPKGLVHFQKNNGRVPAAVIAAFNSQLAGTVSIAPTLFAATPPVPDNVLTKAFQIGTKEVQKIKGSSKLKENPEEFLKDGMKKRYSLHQHTSIHAIQMLMLERLLCLKRNVELLHGVTAYFGTVKQSGKYHTIAVNQDSLITDQCVQFFQLMSLFLMED